MSDPAHAIVWAAIADLVAGVTLIPSAWKDAPIRALPGVVLGLVIGQACGVELLARLPRALVTRLIAAVVFAMAIHLLRQPPAEKVGGSSALGGGLAGTLGGLMGGLVGMPGPPIIAWATRRFDPVQARAALIVVFAVGSLTQMVALSGRGLVTLDWSMLAIVPTTLVANRVGLALSARLDPVTFKRLVVSILLGSALTLAVRG